MSSNPFGDWVWTRAQDQPDAAAIIFQDEEISWAQFAVRVADRISFLDGTGCRPGERVVWLGLNAPNFIELFLACSHLGLVFVPLNTRLSAAEHRSQVENCTPSLLLSDRAMLAQLAEVDARAQLLPDVEAHGPLPSAPPPSAVTSGDDLMIVYTSGTTGLPKGAVHTHAGLNATIDNGRACQDLTDADVALCFLPLFHVGGLNIQLLPTMAAGGTVVLHEAFDPERVLADMQRYRATVSVFVPATMSAVLAQPLFGKTDLSSMRGVMTGSSVVPDELLQAFLDAGLHPGQVYGSTETGPTAVVLRFDEAHHIGAAGRPAALCESRIVDGELQVRGANLFTRYWENEAATEAAFDGDWYRTGDRAHQDDAGMIRIEGRVDDMIVSGGENIFPAQIEDVLVQAPGVAEVAVIGRSHPKWGEVPVAIVVADGEPPTLEALREFAEASLARFKLPAELTIVDSLPRTALGKLQKFKLR